jgi:glycosidase
LDREVFARVIQPALYGYTNDVGRMTYTESHDEERIIREMLESGYSRDEAFRRAQAALVLTLTAPGAAMVYAGQEFGENTKRVVGPNPLHWGLLERRRNQALVETTRAMNGLRPGLGGATLLEGLPGLVAGYERQAADRGIIVLVNFGKTAEAVELALDPACRWRDELGGADIEGGSYSHKLEAGEALVLHSGPCTPN